MDDTIYRQAAIDAIDKILPVNPMKNEYTQGITVGAALATEYIKQLPSAQPERLTDDDFETIRIHLSAFKESLCNQRRWKEAEDYERLISRFMSFASAQPERMRGRWLITDAYPHNVYCSQCYKTFAQTHWAVWEDGTLPRNFCPNCGADMREMGDSNEERH